MRLKAILFDTRSIQKYIFAGSRLRTNIGASYLVDRVYEDGLRPALERVLGASDVDWDGWSEVESPNWAEQHARARIGYIGGGNALVLLLADTPDATCREIVAEFSKHLLTHAPGLKIGAAHGTVALASDGSYEDGEGLTQVVHRLKQSQNEVFPLTNVPYTGLTLRSDVDGESANAYSAELGRYVSQATQRKLTVATPHYRGGLERAQTESALLESLFSVMDAGFRESLAGYAFPTSLDKLGQRETENDIAIIHIDGNNMGVKFASCRTLTERKNMSLAIRRTTVTAFARLVERIVAEYASYDFLKQSHDDEGRAYLPIRPLILGGDDMTFICPAVLAVHFAEFIIAELLRAGIDSCGGIAVLNTSYPFARGYVLAEQACDAAKNKMRSLAAAESEKYREAQSAWLEYVILHGEQAPTLDEIRRTEYRGAGRSLHFGPYRVDDDGSHFALARVKAAARGLRDLPRGKVKELREVLQGGDHAALRYLESLRQLGLALPTIPGWEEYSATVWGGKGKKLSPWCDAIELMDYLPAALEEE